MRASKNPEKSILIITVVMMTIAACKQMYSQVPAATSTPISQNMFASPAATTMSDVQFFATQTAYAQFSTALGTPAPPVLMDLTGTAMVVQSVENTYYGDLQTVDQSLQQSMQANIAYNAPKSMTLDDTVTIVLYINPSQTPQQLINAVTQDPLISGASQPSSIITASVEITDRMKAELLADDKDAFTIQAIPSSPEQLISTIDSTRWAWLLTAHKAGSQHVTLVIYRLVKYTGLEYWRPIQTYKADINVKVTFSQKLASFDWKWLVGTIVPLIGIPSLWSYFTNRKKKTSKQIDE